MAFLEFGPQYEIGIKEVDQQHKKLFEMLSKLHTAIVNGEEQSTLATILDDLIEYTVYHFQSEEELLLKHGCPDYNKQKSAHDKLTVQAVELQQQFHDGSATISFELLDFLHDWLVEHTTGLDRKMIPFMKERGIT